MMGEEGRGRERWERGRRACGWGLGTPRVLSRDTAGTIGREEGEKGYEEMVEDDGTPQYWLAEPVT